MSTKNYKTNLLLMCLFWLVAVILTFHFAPEYSSFAAAFLKAGVSLGVYFLIDKYIIGSIDTFEELKKGNVAYAIFLFGIFLIISASILAS